MAQTHATPLDKTTAMGGEVQTDAIDTLDPLWVPLLTHYDRGRPGEVDPARMMAHVGALRGHVRQFLIAGSTGDGWEIGDPAYRSLVRLSLDPGVFGSETRVLFGALRPTTGEVIDRIAVLEGMLRAEPRRATRVAGVTVCPPVDPAATQAGILDHYAQVFAATTLPVAVYQLPQVTGCFLEPRTVLDLIGSGRVAMFKDSSGTDAVAAAGAARGAVALRGAEGNYAEALRPVGAYDGWLLSTGNAFAGCLQEVASFLRKADSDTAAAVSAGLTRAVERVFGAAQQVGFGNAFSNANRACDHVLAWGARWRDADPPLSVSGARLPLTLLEEAELAVSTVQNVPARGYLEADNEGALQ
jgi:4-hydroxy-tetrahydrodipicolinate synthase